MTLFQELPYDGLLGIGPSATPLQDQQSFTKTLFNSGLISNHSLTFRHVPQRNNAKEIEFGYFGHTKALVRYHLETVNPDLNTMRIDVSTAQLGNYTFPTTLGYNAALNMTVDPMWIRVNLILGSDPFITYETPILAELDEFQTFMGHFFPDFTIQRGKNRFNHTVITAQTGGKNCTKQQFKQGELQNFTFNTSRAHQFHIPYQSMMFDTYMGYPIG